MPQLDPALVTDNWSPPVRSTDRPGNQKVGGEPGSCDRRCLCRLGCDSRSEAPISSYNGAHAAGLYPPAEEIDATASTVRRSIRTRRPGGRTLADLAEQSSLRFALIRKIPLVRTEAVRRVCMFPALLWIAGSACRVEPTPSTPLCNEQLGRRRQRVRRTLRSRRVNGRGSRPARRRSEGRADRVGRQSYRSRHRESTWPVASSRPRSSIATYIWRTSRERRSSPRWDRCRGGPGRAAPHFGHAACAD